MYKLSTFILSHFFSSKKLMIYSNFLFPPPFSLRSSCTSRKRFTPEEDAKLKALCIESKNWEEVAKQMPGRTARQCRDRYNVSLKNYIIKKPWTEEEDEIIIQKYHEIGPKWVAISSFLVGRSGNNVKNRWHKHINKEHKYSIPKSPSAGENSKKDIIEIENREDEVSQKNLFEEFNNIDNPEILESLMDKPLEFQMKGIDKVNNEEKFQLNENKPQENFLNPFHSINPVSFANGSDCKNSFCDFFDSFESNDLCCMNKTWFNDVFSLDSLY